MTRADQVTLSRLAITPLAVSAYLLLPLGHGLCLWVAGALCGLAEYTDLADGRIARARNEVSDFGKLADPFCDVIYRLSLFLALLLPAGGSGWPVTLHGDPTTGALPLAALTHRQCVYALPDGRLGAGLVPWLPVLLMVVRELIAGALRALAASTGVVLAARASGKLKAWLQGIVLIAILALPAFCGVLRPWQLELAFWGTWVCAVASVLSILEYIWVNRSVLARLLDRRPLVPR